MKQKNKDIRIKELEKSFDVAFEDYNRDKDNSLEGIYNYDLNIALANAIYINDREHNSELLPVFKAIQTRFINELIFLHNELIKGKSGIEIKVYYERAVDYVKQNINVYPILLNYMDYIKENILRDKLGLPEKRKIEDVRVFEYITDIILSAEALEEGNTRKKIVDKIKGYYHHKFLDLLSLKPKK